MREYQLNQLSSCICAVPSRHILQKIIKSADQRVLRPTVTTTSGTSSRISPLAAHLPAVYRLVPENGAVDKFAVNVSLFSNHSNKEVTEVAMWKALTKVEEWRQRQKLTLDASQCDVAFFTNNSKEALWQPLMQLKGTLLCTTSLPKSLGITINRTLQASYRRSNFQST